MVVGAAIFDTLSSEFHTAFFNPALNTYCTGLQTELAVALTIEGVVPTAVRAAVLRNLVDDIVDQHHYHTSSGIIGIIYVLPVIAESGRADVALEMLLQDTFPSYGFMIKGGANGYEPATTLWELWDTDTGSADMDSRNHIMFGSVGGFFYRYLLGVRPILPGFTQMKIQPVIVTHPKLTHAAGTVVTPLGDVNCAWASYLLPSVSFMTNLTIPSGATAYVMFADVLAGLIQESGAVVWSNDSFIGGVGGVLGGSMTEGVVTLQVISGEFEFFVQKTIVVDS